MNRKTAGFLTGILCFSILLASAQEKKEDEIPFELEVILTDYEKRLDDGTLRLSQSTVEKLSKLKESFLRVNQSEKALAVAKAIVELEAEIAELKKRQEARRSFTATKPRKTNDIRDELTRVKWLRVGKREGIGRTRYILKPDGSAEGFILDAQGNPGNKTAWTRWEFRGKTLQIGPASGGGETFTYDAEKGIFSGTMSELLKEKPPARQD